MLSFTVSSQGAAWVIAWTQLSSFFRHLDGGGGPSAGSLGGGGVRIMFSTLVARALFSWISSSVWVWYNFHLITL